VKFKALGAVIGFFLLAGMAVSGGHFYFKHQRSAEIERKLDRLIEQRKADTPAIAMTTTRLETCTLMIWADKSEVIEKISDEELREQIERATVKVLSELGISLPEKELKTLVDANITYGIETRCGLPYPLLRYWRVP
jgi:type III secretory pathway component EscV